MLFARLQREHEGPAAFLVHGLAHDAAGHLAQVILLNCHKAHVRAAIAQGQAKGLAVANGDIGTPFCGRCHHGKCGRIAVLHQKGLLVVNQIGKTAVVLHYAIAVDGGHDHACDILGSQSRLQRCQRRLSVGRLHIAQLHAVELCVCLNYSHHVRQQGLGQQYAGLLAGRGHTHHHRLGGGRGAVVHRGI